MAHTKGAAPARTGGYYLLFLVLCGLAVLNIGLSFVPAVPHEAHGSHGHAAHDLDDPAGQNDQIDPTVRFGLHMAVAGVGAFLLSFFFMHLKEADKLTWLIVAASIFWIGIMFTLILTDYFTRQWGAI